jgi:hypothetical protein
LERDIRLRHGFQSETNFEEFKDQTDGLGFAGGFGYYPAERVYTQSSFENDEQDRLYDQEAYSQRLRT